MSGVRRRCPQQGSSTGDRCWTGLRCRAHLSISLEAEKQRTERGPALPTLVTPPQTKLRGRGPGQACVCQRATRAWRTNMTHTRAGRADATDGRERSA
eukprot:4959892-Prymnesium_polylepis.1